MFLFTICSVNIIEQLRLENISPEASSSSVLDDSPDYAPSIAISYLDKYEAGVPYFNSKREPMTQYWMVDFKKNVTLESYQIIAEEIHMIYKWNLTISSDGIWWKLVHSDNNGRVPTEKITFTLDKPEKVQYARIDGISKGREIQTNFGFWAVKFFGSTTPPAEKKVVCFTGHTSFFANIYYYVFLCCFLVQ